MTPSLLLAADAVRAAASTPPTRERGSQTRLSQVSPALGLTVGLLQDQEYNRAWRWPQTWRTVDTMRSDSQIEALYNAISLSVRRRAWALDPNGADDTLVEAVAYDLGLPVRGDDTPQTRGRQHDRFSWDQHLQHALLGLLYGLYDFEIVGHIDAAGAWRLDKLAPRPPRTIMYASADEVGEFASVTQLIGRAGDPAEPIPAEHLVHYCWDREGANWYGRSVLRAIYREFDIKDGLIKVDAIKHRRNGMGVPVGRITDSSVAGNERVLQDLRRMASAMRAGEESGGATPFGTDVDLKGVQGTLPDTLASIKEHNEAMARRFHAMFMMLGQTSHGSRALGESFVDFFALNTDTYAAWLADTATQQLVERWVAWNAGPDERAPRIVSERDETPELAAQDVLQAVKVGALQPYPGLSRWIIDRYGLPDPDDPAELEPATTPPVALPPGPAARRRAPARAATVVEVEVDGVRLPDRPLRRQPSGPEAAAGVDFAAIEQAYVDAVDELVAGLDTLRADQIADLVEQVRAAGDDLEALAQVSTDPVGAEQIAASMRAAALSGAQEALSEARHQGVDEALAEARHQGVDVDGPDVAALEDAIMERAAVTAQLLAANVSSTAADAAVRLHGATGLEGDLADSVETYLGALRWSYAEQQARGVVQASQNQGRFLLMDEAERAATDTRYYHSALLDQNTCGPCADQDGEEYADLQDVEASFAGSGGYALCEGANRCRCTAVAVHGEAAPTLQ